jgi:hypothetical protein
LQAPLIEMSGTPRLPPTTLATPFWYHGRLKKMDVPPPPASGFGPLSPKMYCWVGVL